MQYDTTIKIKCVYIFNQVFINTNISQYKAENAVQLAHEKTTQFKKVLFNTNENENIK